jgi:hypothetical protein
MQLDYTVVFETLSAKSTLAYRCGDSARLVSASRLTPMFKTLEHHQHHKYKVIFLKLRNFSNQSNFERNFMLSSINLEIVF